MIHYERKGEWLEVRAVKEDNDCSFLPLSEKWIHRLRATKELLIRGGKVRLRLFSEEDIGFEPIWMELDVLYEDDFVLVVNKPAGLPVHPVSEDQTHSLAGAVAAYYEMTGQACAVRHIHRLDADTTGPVLYAKCRWAQSVLDEAMRKKWIERIYVAIVKGCPAQVKGTIDAQIGKDRHHGKRRRVSPTGVRAISHYEVIDRWHCTDALRAASMLRVKLETGRTHQIRVHLQHIGHPLFGDELYHGPAFRGLKRQALHGESLRFLHPWEQSSMKIDAPLPGDLMKLVSSLRK